MASNKGRKRLDQPSGNTLTQIDDALSWLVESAKENVIKPDEFTVEMAVKRLIDSGSPATDDAIRFRLDRMVKNGELTKRKINLGGFLINAYKRV